MLVTCSIHHIHLCHSLSVYLYIYISVYRCVQDRITKEEHEKPFRSILGLDSRDGIATVSRQLIVTYSVLLLFAYTFTFSLHFIFYYLIVFHSCSTSVFINSFFVLNIICVTSFSFIFYFLILEDFFLFFFSSSYYYILSVP